jgi:hypothetical protein
MLMARKNAGPGGSLTPSHSNSDGSQRTSPNWRSRLQALDLLN